MNKHFDDSKLGEKIIDIILPLETVYKEDKGESLPAQLRHGRLDDDLYYNRKVINTRYSDTPFNSRIKVYFRAFTDDNAIIAVDIYNNNHNEVFKKFIIRSTVNNYNIIDMKNICDKIKNILNDDNDDNYPNGKTVALIEYIRNKENLKFDEIAQ